MKLEVAGQTLELPLYSLLHLVNMSVRRTATCDEGTAIYLFTNAEVAEQARERLGDDALRRVEHADPERLVNFLEELMREHKLTHIIFNPCLNNGRPGPRVAISEMITELRTQY